MKRQIILFIFSLCTIFIYVFFFSGFTEKKAIFCLNEQKGCILKSRDSLGNELPQLFSVVLHIYHIVSLVRPT